MDIWQDIFRCALARWSQDENPGDWATMVMALGKGSWWRHLLQG